MSKGFAMKDGDVVITDTIEMVDGDEHLRTKAELVVSTCKGEWVYDLNEGIDRYIVLRKNPVDDEIRATIESALKGVDDTFAITEYSRKMTGRNAAIDFRATNSDGAEVGGEYTYGG